MPPLVLAGISLSISNSRAVLGALRGSRSAFERTAKYSGDRSATALARKTYGRRGGWRAIANLAAATYFAVCLGVAVDIEHWLGLPVIALFLAGFSYAGFSMLTDARTGDRAVLRTADDSAP